MSTDSLCQLLEWDSTFFGVRIAQIKSDRLSTDGMMEALDWCQKQRVRCLYFMCAPDHDESVRLAELHQFHLVDIRMELIWRPKSNEQIGPESLETNANTVRLYHDEDRSELLKIVETAYYDTRFYYDRNFARDQASALYREWIIRSCSGFANAVLVALNHDGIGGFVTCHTSSPQRGRVGLVGVRNDLRGQGIGGVIIRAAQKYFVQRGVDQVQVITQGRNIAAQRLYQKCGFRSQAIYLWYHRWFSDTGEKDG